jgi:AcrR family transcriptional regulator
MPRTRAATYEVQREAILARAAELFAQRGYTATSMNEVALACGVSKAALYHYVTDKSELLAEIALDHVQRLERVVAEVEAATAEPAERLRQLILRFVQEYADARHQHRVLTEDVRFLDAAQQARILGAQRQVVEAFARTVVEVRPELASSGLHKAVTMLLFGMINWMFTWLRPDGPLTHEQMGPVVCDLFFGGLTAVRAAA